MAANHWNRNGRRSGGQRPQPIIVPLLTADEVAIVVQRERIRAEFGEAGARKFDEALLAHGKEREECLKGKT